MARLREQWERSRPSVVTRTMVGKSQGSDIVCDNELTLVGMEEGKVRVLRNDVPAIGGKVSGVDACSTVATLDCWRRHSWRLTVQFWLGPDVIVTVGDGLVQCWNRQTFELEYRRAHHARSDNANVYGVTVLGNGMIATGADRGEVIVLTYKHV